MWENHFLAAIKDAIKKPLATYAKTDADAEAAAAAWTVTSPSNRDLLTMCATWRRRSATAAAELACCGKEEGTLACLALWGREGRHT